MSDGQNPERGCRLKVDDVVWEARHGAPAHGQRNWDSRYQAPGAGHLHNLIDRGIDGIEELDAQVLPALLRPAAAKPVSGIRFVLEPNARIHPRRSSASARRRTSSHGTPAVSPAITRRARRSISSAQAASTSAQSAAAASSRLANAIEIGLSGQSFVEDSQANCRWPLALQRDRTPPSAGATLQPLAGYWAIEFCRLLVRRTRSRQYGVAALESNSMVITSGRVVAGKIIVDGEPLPDGTVVTVLTREGDETFTLVPEAEAELLESLAEADRGETIPAEEVLRALRKLA